MLVLDKVDFLPPCHSIRRFARVVVAAQHLEGKGPHDITKNALDGSAVIERGPLRMSLLSTLPDGTHVACCHVSIIVQAVAVRLDQNLQTLRIDLSHAAVPEVKGLRPQGPVCVVLFFCCPAFSRRSRVDWCFLAVEGLSLIHI